MFTSLLVTALAMYTYAPPAPKPHHAPAARLTLETYVADSASFHVVSTLIVGPTEVIVFDAQNHMSDGRRLAERIAATGRHLKALVLSHPDEDHFFGALAVLDRFPGTPVYMTPAGLREFARVAEGMRAQLKPRLGAEAPDSLIHPQAMPAGGLTVDGERVQVIADLQGDVLTPCNTALWIPSIRAILAGDIAFNGVYPYLAASSEASRSAWHKSLDSLAAYEPAIVVSGHKWPENAPDSPEVLAFMHTYLNDFEAARKSSADARAMYLAILAKYRTLSVPMLLQYSVQMTFGK